MQSSLLPAGATSRRDRRLERRHGFTLIELLVVIAVILILAGLILSVYGAVIGNARVSATKQRIKVVQDALAQRLDSFTRYFSNPQNLQNQPEWLQAMADASGDTELATILAKKKLMRRFFPQNFKEYSMSAGTSHSAATESAEVLYFILTQGTELGEPAITAGALDAAAIKDTDGDGLKEIVDAWDKPLRFYRWPTRLVKTDGVTVNTTYLKLVDSAAPTSTTQLASDQDDPLGKTSGISSFESSYHTPATYHLLLVVSAGGDGELGLYEPSDYSNFGYLAAPTGTAATDLADNFTNLNVVVGGK